MMPRRRQNRGEEGRLRWAHAGRARGGRARLREALDGLGLEGRGVLGRCLGQRRPGVGPDEPAGLALAGAAGRGRHGVLVRERVRPALAARRGDDERDRPLRRRGPAAGGRRATSHTGQARMRGPTGRSRGTREQPGVRGQSRRLGERPAKESARAIAARLLMNQCTLVRGPASGSERSFSFPSQRNAGLRESLTCVFSMRRRDERTLAMSYRRLTCVGRGWANDVEKGRHALAGPTGGEGSRTRMRGGR